MNAVYNVTKKVLNSFFGIILCLISTAAFFMPYELRYMPEVKQYLTPVQTVCGILLIICFFLLYISQLRVFRDNLVLWLAVLFVAVLIYATSLNGGWMEEALSDKGLFAIANLLIFAVFIKVNPKKYLLVMFLVYLVFTCWNNYSLFKTWLVGMMNYEEGFIDDRFSLVGNYNLGIMYAMPMLITGTVWASKYGKWLEIFTYAGCIYTILMAVKCKSDTQIIIFAICLAVMICNDIMYLAKGFYKFLRIFNSAVLLILDFIIFIIFVLGKNITFLQKLGFSGDFHNRRVIWDAAINAITNPGNQPWGVGVWNELGTTQFLYPTDAAHCHCFFLEVPFRTGYIGAAIFVAMLVLTSIAIFRAKNIHVKWLLSAFIGLTFLAGIVEAYPTVFMIIVIGLCYYIAVKDREDELALAAAKEENGNLSEEGKDENPLESADGYRPDGKTRPINMDRQAYDRTLYTDRERNREKHLDTDSLRRFEDRYYEELWGVKRRNGYSEEPQIMSKRDSLNGTEVISFDFDDDDNMVTPDINAFDDSRHYHTGEQGRRRGRRSSGDNNAYHLDKDLHD